jgi:inorganic pyrophosphatase/exopolyphosphatase
MTLLTFLCIIIFLIGLYFYSKSDDPKYYEAMTNQSRYPNLLIQKDSKFYLYNSKLVKVPGVNPVEFENLEDYTEFLDWQRSQGIRCPVLYLQ